MAIIGIDGNDAPELIEGIPAHIWMGIQARAYTARFAEPNRPDFGLGLIDGLTPQILPRHVWQDRINKSFVGLDGWEQYELDVVAVGNKVELVVRLRRAQ